MAKILLYGEGLKGIENILEEYNHEVLYAQVKEAVLPLTLCTELLVMREDYDLINELGKERCKNKVVFMTNKYDKAKVNYKGRVYIVSAEANDKDVCDKVQKILSG